MYDIPKYKGNPTSAPKGQTLMDVMTIPGFTMKITNLQAKALEQYAKSHPNFYGSQAYINAVGNFSKQDKKGNYAVTVNIN